MHGLSLATGIAVRHLHRSPLPLLADAAQSSGARLLAFPDQSRRLACGLSLTRNDRPSPDRHSEINASGLPFRRLPGSCRTRSELGHPCKPGCPNPPGYPPSRCSVRRPTLQKASRISTPLWGFLCPSGSKRSIRAASRKLTSANRPISLRSPPPGSFLSSPAMDQRSRSATFRSARCFHEPLGTRAIMKQSGFEVNWELRQI